MDNSVSETQGGINQPPQQQQSIQPIQNKSSISSKWILLSIIGVALLIIVLGGVYLLGTKNSQQSLKQVVQQEVVKPTPTPTPDETANWKVYNDTKNVFSLKYPQNWQFIKDSSHDTQGGSLRTFADGNTKSNDPNYGQAEILISWSTAINTYDKALAKPKGFVDKHDITTVTTLDKFVIQGYQAVEQSVMIGPCPANAGDCASSFAQDVFIKGPVTLSLSLIPLKYNQQGYSQQEFERMYIPVFHKILSTFQFLK